MSFYGNDVMGGKTHVLLHFLHLVLTFTQPLHHIIKGPIQETPGGGPHKGTHKLITVC